MLSLRSFYFSVFLIGSLACWGQDKQEQPPSNREHELLERRERELLERIDKLEQRLAALESKSAGTPAPAQASASPPVAPATAKAAASNDRPFAFPDGTTLNFGLDTYYGYNFNHPLGRVNLLRSNDPLSNSFSVNQAVAIVERAPDLAAKRRFGYRLDLLFGQQTDISQGSAANEPRPQVYRNINQAYGSYIVPFGDGLRIDFGKFSSALGIESTYVKDQLNYSRSYLFAFLPFYHAGLRATYNVTNKLTLQYWLVNGANQTEDFNGFKSQAALFTLKPNKNITWQANYYEGQEQRDVQPLYIPAIPALSIPPGLSIAPVTAAHDGRFHVIDSYANLNFGLKWSTAFEGDYVWNRVASNSTPQRAFGGAAYLHRQLTPALAANGRFTYLADRGGLFGIDQNLKEFTLTGVYQFANGFQTRLEFRRDFSNLRFFLTNTPGALSQSQNTATIGLLWWFGGKEGAW